MKKLEGRRWRDRFEDEDEDTLAPRPMKDSIMFFLVVVAIILVGAIIGFMIGFLNGFLF